MQIGYLWLVYLGLSKQKASRSPASQDLSTPAKSGSAQCLYFHTKSVSSHWLWRNKIHILGRCRLIHVQNSMYNLGNWLLMFASTSGQMAPAFFT